VAKATPVVTWVTPSAIQYGTALGATQLNATANVAGSFSYSPVAGTVPSVGSQTLTATFTPTDTTDYAAPVTATVQLMVTAATAADFSVNASPAQQTILAGNSAAYIISVAPLSGGFSSAVTLSAGGLPAGVTASFSPTSVTPNAGAVYTTMTLSTSTSTAANRRPLLPVGGGMAMLAAILAGFGLRGARKASRSMLAVVITLLSLGIAVGLTGCGGSSSGFTPNQNYTVTVTATSGSISHTTEVILTVE
jgi:hypothetical protein